MGKKRVVVGFADSRNLARAVAKRSRSEYTEAELKDFPDKESYLRYKTDLKGKMVYILRSLNDPNRKIVELLLAAYTAKELGAKKVILIAPYLCYMRQDKRFKPGEAISSKIIARLFNACFDELITVDPHLHRYKSLNDIFIIKSKKLTAVQPIADFIKKNIKTPFILGPDMESYQWARKVASSLKCGVDVLKKHRYGSETVRIKIKEGLDLKDKGVVIVDDVISTGHTVMEVVKDVKALGAKKIYCVCTHGVFAEDSLRKIRRLGASVYSTNTIENAVSEIDVTEMITKEIK